MSKHPVLGLEVENNLNRLLVFLAFIHLNKRKNLNGTLAPLTVSQSFKYARQFRSERFRAASSQYWQPI